MSLLLSEKPHLYCPPTRQAQPSRTPIGLDEYLIARLAIGLPVLKTNLVTFHELLFQGTIIAPVRSIEYRTN